VTSKSNAFIIPKQDKKNDESDKVENHKRIYKKLLFFNKQLTETFFVFYNKILFKIGPDIQ
jgi:hypothetical protein